ncbi:hypothetical protein [Vibrio parahaemolyticus]|uniref:hypothetical protein n=1 Tax=Vibrio parahaemolyticus TaxID=670 RepID=UPI001110E9AD|nr:hypothetical protein [Vibrio parahaemolyticus]MBE4384994.1 hypothetical protein [Vibrio parahaemolyticus]MEA5230239.1 hypothetical protein [Vibrio parahaemolyticus]TMX39639.1 hypothetical protein DA098_10145 [Vibrio parahaemolyticus]TMX80295.1 hypothetical protein DA094_01835 [Vibrio parahaemolyticus]WHT06108.1 hypothetical protein O2T11_26010 [Vibrio parahaemolyticus]
MKLQQLIPLSILIAAGCTTTTDLQRESMLENLNQTQHMVIGSESASIGEISIEYQQMDDANLVQKRNITIFINELPLRVKIDTCEEANPLQVSCPSNFQLIKHGDYYLYTSEVNFLKELERRGDTILPTHVVRSIHGLFSDEESGFSDQSVNSDKKIGNDFPKVITTVTLK